PAFHGHSDLHNTSCPGGNVISRWGEIRNATKIKTDAINAGDVISQPPTNNNPGGGDNAGDNAGNGGEQQAGVEDLSSALPGLSSIAERGMNQQGSSDFSPEETQAVAAVASAVAGLAITAGAVTLPESGDEIIPGVTIEALPGIISKVLTVTGNEEAGSAFDTLINAFGPVLGQPIGGPNSENAQLVYQLFNNGVVLSSEETGAHALIGEFARAWAEGDTATELGLPTSDQYSVDQVDGGNAGRVDFQGGYITFDPHTATVDVHTNYSACALFLGTPKRPACFLTKLRAAFLIPLFSRRAWARKGYSSQSRVRSTALFQSAYNWSRTSSSMFGVQDLSVATKSSKAFKSSQKP